MYSRGDLLMIYFSLRIIFVLDLQPSVPGSQLTSTDYSVYSRNPLNQTRLHPKTMLCREWRKNDHQRNVDTNDRNEYTWQDPLVAIHERVVLYTVVFNLNARVALCTLSRTKCRTVEWLVKCSWRGFLNSRYCFQCFVCQHRRITMIYMIDYTRCRFYRISSLNTKW